MPGLLRKYVNSSVVLGWLYVEYTFTSVSDLCCGFSQEKDIV